MKHTKIWLLVSVPCCHQFHINAPVSVNRVRGWGGGMGNPGDSDIPPRSLWQWCSDPGTDLTFKIKRFPPPAVGNRRDSDTKCANRVGTLREEIFKCLNPLSLAHGGGWGMDPGDSHWPVSKLHVASLSNHLLFSSQYWNKIWPLIHNSLQRIFWYKEK